MKSLLGIILIVAGIVVGVYFGLFWAFIGGIVALIEQIRAPHIDVTIMTLSILRILFASAIGWLSAMVLLVPGYLMVTRR